MSEPDQRQMVPVSGLVFPVDEKIAIRKDPALHYIGLEHIGTRNARLLGSASPESSVSVNSVFQQGDVLFGKLRPNLRKCVSAPFAGYCSTDILVLRARPGHDPHFAARVFQTEALGNEAERTSMGTKMPRTSWSGLSKFKVNVPSLPEQSNIAEILDTLDEAIRGTEAVVGKLKAAKQGLLHDLLTRGITTQGDLRPPHTEAPHLYHQTPLDWLPKEWAVVPLGSVTRELTQGWSPDCPPESALAHEWGILKTTAVVWAGYQNTENKRLPEGFRPRPQLEVAAGDILITRAGPSSRVAVVAFVEETRDKLMISDKIYRLRTVPQVAPAFLALALSSQAVQREISKTVSGMAESQTNISQATLRPLIVPLPAKSEQEGIVAAQRAHVVRLVQEEALLAKLRLQKSGLMEDLLTGRVSVQALL